MALYKDNMASFDPGSFARDSGQAYLDDWIVTDKTSRETEQHTSIIVNKLQVLGWLVNTTESMLDPSQVLHHLGYELDTRIMTIRLPDDKLRDLRRSIQQLLKHPVQTPRRVHSLTMRIQAATIAIFPARLCTQHLMRFKNQIVKRLNNWDRHHQLTQGCTKELQWRVENLQLWNGRSIIPQAPKHALYVDASDRGWGAHWRNKRISGLWSREEAQQPINWRELKAVELALQTFRSLRQTSIRIRTDYVTSLTYINRQGETRSTVLSDLASSLWKMCLPQTPTDSGTYFWQEHHRGHRISLLLCEMRMVKYSNKKAQMLNFEQFPEYPILKNYLATCLYKGAHPFNFFFFFDSHHIRYFSTLRLVCIYETIK